MKLVTILGLILVWLSFWGPRVAFAGEAEARAAVERCDFDAARGAWGSASGYVESLSQLWVKQSAECAAKPEGTAGEAVVKARCFRELGNRDPGTAGADVEFGQPLGVSGVALLQACDRFQMARLQAVERAARAGARAREAEDLKARGERSQTPEGLSEALCSNAAKLAAVRSSLEAEKSAASISGHEDVPAMIRLGKAIRDREHAEAELKGQYHAASGGETWTISKCP